MTLDPSIITKYSLGFILGISLGVFIRMVLFRLLIIASIPALMLLILDYTGAWAVDWQFLSDKWNAFLVFLTPMASNVFAYLKNQNKILFGLIPGIYLGCASRFFFMRR